MSRLRFQAQELRRDLPPPGWYPARITSARFRSSASGNQMIQIVYGLLELDAAHLRLAEYFVLEGVSPNGLGLARRRLVELFYAAGHHPQPGDEISPALLVGAELEIELELDVWNGQARLRVARHRPHQRDPQLGLERG